MGQIKWTVISIAIASLLPMAALAQPPATTPSEPPHAIGTMPTRGMNMTLVRKHFGQPEKIVNPVGDPPISRWIYDGFIVYFERNHVIHAIVPTHNR